jgi:serine-type D-Ala-D-Ala carboxypeptidase/endopeptidase (penicillin-binding protein 4)
MWSGKILFYPRHLLGVIFSLLFFFSIQAFAIDNANIPGRQYIQNGGYAFKPWLQPVDGYHSDMLFTPASTTKMVTCLMALKILGPDYRFTTNFFLDPSGNLFIKGEGDPFLTSEIIAEIGKEIYHQGIRHVTSIILDESVFALESSVDGSEHSTNPYDAEIGALAVNFNTLPIRIQSDGRLDSNEKQTPLLPIMEKIGENLKPGHYRLNVGAFPVSDNIPNELRYVGELFRALFSQQNIQTGKIIRLGKVPKNAILVFSHRSDTVREIVRDCLEFSNNFIANQLFIACGRISFGQPATWQKSRLALKRFTRDQLKLDPRTITIIEGSGLSRKNRLTPQAMVKVLEAFLPFADLLPTKHDLLIKSGTLKGVYCYAGYLQDHGHSIPFAIMLNQQINSREQILNLLISYLQQPEILLQNNPNKPNIELHY